MYTGVWKGSVHVVYVDLPMVSVWLQEIPEVVNTTAQGAKGPRAVLSTTEGISCNSPEVIG